MTGILDRLPPLWRHAAFSFVAVFLATELPYVAANYTTWQLSPVVLTVVGMCLPLAIAYSTKLTTRYGVGSTAGV
ncbi:hypothetical protein UFOVP1183_48 [uncultured Caudovirales phage]|uniref:Uncharacterized protein n=1 Tax=uncultured Caudovirales phage TaxID=2100421 RepID=A0A6J5PQQ5_9CAUD|nr:hypothetical protein UFOVP955_34 [uncultured Caudovirales phage]CAB4185125.1 hypothetical protein UFOVP1120_5 [uncultured Caudovirales phage]CAB4188587.1 hypothetical protein UFOVP1183_48 [uncultured Caudovirales phage]CAB4191373.1 hypothetical protein UFOVP1227_31 [uncultured Caudovirales phage]CAB5229593.1 hypothetical protein UFOVP1571_5 [uncultured Caudovirales phage]